MVLSCGILLIYMLHFMTKLSERIDVSIPSTGSSTNPVVSDDTPGRDSRALDGVVMKIKLKEHKETIFFCAL